MTVQSSKGATLGLRRDSLNQSAFIQNPSSSLLTAGGRQSDMRVKRRAQLEGFGFLREIVEPEQVPVVTALCGTACAPSHWLFSPQSGAHAPQM